MRLLSITLVLFVLGCSSSDKISDEEKKWLSGELNRSEPVVSGTDKDNPSRSKFVMRPGYLIQLSHPVDKKLNKKFRIQSDGKLYLPYQKSVMVEGLTLKESLNQINSTYRSLFTEQAGKVDGKVVDWRFYIELRGLINKPGKYLIKNTTSLDEIIKMGEWFPKESSVKFIRIDQGNANTFFDLSAYYRTGDQSNLPKFIGGEQLFFLEESNSSLSQASSITIKIMGEVEKSGEYQFQKGWDFYRYFSQAGGPTLYADSDRIELIRGTSYKRKSKVLKLSQLNEFVKIQPGDIIIVHSNQRTRLEREVSLTASIATIISSIAIVILALL